jgi:hypothetical protein
MGVQYKRLSDIVDKMNFPRRITLHAGHANRRVKNVFRYCRLFCLEVEKFYLEAEGVGVPPHFAIPTGA